jgi:hypothetical protein
MIEIVVLHSLARMCVATCGASSCRSSVEELASHHSGLSAQGMQLDQTDPVPRAPSDVAAELGDPRCRWRAGDRAIAATSSIRTELPPISGTHPRRAIAAFVTGASGVTECHERIKRFHERRPGRGGSNRAACHATMQAWCSTARSQTCPRVFGR